MLFHFQFVSSIPSLTLLAVFAMRQKEQNRQRLLQLTDPREVPDLMARQYDAHRQVMSAK